MLSEKQKLARISGHPVRAVQVGDIWIIWNDREPFGPYGSEEDAESDRKGLERFYRLHDRPGYMTSDSKGK